MQADKHTNQELMLEVGDGYALYVQDWGNADAETVFIFLHGGPGSQLKDKHKAPFDPNTQRVIFFDQRGCGKSTPFGSLENNTTGKMIDDITTIADRLNIKTFVLVGSSWGSTLALAYAINHPDRTKALVIGGVFTGSKTESAWLDDGGFKTFYPEVWQAYLERTPVEYRNDPSAYHFDKALRGTPEEQKLSAYAYARMEAGVMKLDDRQSDDDFEEYDPTGMRIEMHYMSQGCLMPDRFVFDNAARLTMPVHMVQGRYDMVCPPAVAYELHRLLPNSKLYWTIAGHTTEHETENLFRSILASLV